MSTIALYLGLLPDVENITLKHLTAAGELYRRRTSSRADNTLDYSMRNKII